MCIGVPVQVIEDNGIVAKCKGRNGEVQVNMMLVGPQPVGTWLLNFLGSAREVVTKEEADKIERAFDALNEVMNGQENIDVEKYFPDLQTDKSKPQ